MLTAERNVFCFCGTINELKMITSFAFKSNCSYFISEYANFNGPLQTAIGEFFLHVLYFTLITSFLSNKQISDVETNQLQKWLLFGDIMGLIVEHFKTADEIGTILYQFLFLFVILVTLCWSEQSMDLSCEIR